LKIIDRLEMYPFCNIQIERDSMDKTKIISEILKLY
jgi:hypothetical protein